MTGFPIFDFLVQKRHLHEFPFCRKELLFYTLSGSRLLFGSLNLIIVHGFRLAQLLFLSFAKVLIVLQLFGEIPAFTL